MNKAKRLIVAAGALAVLILAGCDFVRNPDYVDSFNLPPERPYCEIVKSGDPGTGYNAVSFVMEWKRPPPGILPYTTLNPVYEKRASIASLDIAREKWEEYTSLIDPLPFYDKGVTNPNPYEVISQAEGLDNQWLLDNRNPAANGNIVIHRYWPKIVDVEPTVAVWYAAVATRARAFKKAAAEIEGMMAAIRASPFYAGDTATGTFMDTGNTGVLVEVPNPLRQLYDSMAKFIAYNPPLEQCVQRDRFDLSVQNGFYNRRVVLNPLVTGPLYEYYLGYVPYLGDYLDQTVHFSFPGTTRKP
ncbi:hypothetical protein AGMMS49940_20040 [Spirochaetia bacterium]|nr:hypothetical protein AGMMS49940_20040 [Spirochaetia bacterium]